MYRHPRMHLQHCFDMMCHIVSVTTLLSTALHLWDHHITFLIISRFVWLDPETPRFL